MLNCTEILYSENFNFLVFGTETMPTQVRKYLDRLLERNLNQKKLTSILKAISSNPLMYSHRQKFKHLEGDVWEIKIKQIRIACVWDKKPINLIAIYGFNKKRDDWSPKDLNNMRTQRLKYYSITKKKLEGAVNGRIKQIQGKSGEKS